MMILDDPSKFAGQFLLQLRLIQFRDFVYAIPQLRVKQIKV